MFLLLQAYIKNNRRGGKKGEVLVKRYEPIQQFIDKKGVGLEIGPSHNPIAPKRAGYNVDIIDHADRAGLLVKYEGQGVKLDNIEEVDFVWSGEKYSELTGHTKHYDWVIASHVIEHVPDFIGFINDCDEILKESGLLILVVPDATHCFDYFRSITSISRIIDSHIAGKRFHSVGTAVDHLLNFCTMDGDICWSTLSNGEFRFMYPVAEAKRRLESSADDEEYTDYHAWCFTPHSFRLLIEDLYNLGLIRVREFAFIPTGGFEFFIILGGEGDGPKQSRLQLSQRIKEEMLQEKTIVKRLYSSLLRMKKKLIRRVIA